MGDHLFKKALAEFISRLNYASHILPLLEDENIAVLFCASEQSEIALIFEGKDAQVAQNNREGYTLTIRGDLTMLLQLIEGKAKLQDLKKRGEIIVEGKFRYILKLESILYCCSFETRAS